MEGFIFEVNRGIDILFEKLIPEIGGWIEQHPLHTASGGFI